MSEQPDFTLPREIEGALKAIFSHTKPDPTFVERLGRQLSDQVDQFTTQRRKVQVVVSPLVWGAIAIIFIAFLVWGINTLIPRNVPGRSIKSSPPPAVSPSPQLPTLSTLFIENAVFYTVEAGDTFSIIEKKTGVPMNTLWNLNEFVLQLNKLAPGLQLVIGFKGQTPVLYTVQERDTILGICDKAGISLEDFVTLNRIGLYAPGIATPLPIPDYDLTPGMHVIIGLENKATKYDEGTGGKYIVLSEVDLNCDGYKERILGIEAPEIEYFNIKPQLSVLILESNIGNGFKKVWEETAQEAGVSYLAYQLFQADNCNQFLVVIGHNGKEAVNVYRWDGERLKNVLKLSGSFLFEGSWMVDVFGDYETLPNTLFLGELQQPTTSSKNIWILREYQWSDGVFKMIMEKRVELSAGG
jgi:hypothetical protein